MSETPYVAESQAEGKVKLAFDDIKLTLGVAAVGRLFEELAAYPWFLQLAWRNLKPNVQTLYFHKTAHQLEDMALRSAKRRRARGAGTETISPAEARLDLDAKQLAAAAALRYGVNGQLPKMLWLGAGEKQIQVPQPVQVVPIDSPEPGPESKLSAELRQHAALAAESLPYRMEISASACRQSGLTEDNIDSVRAVLNNAWQLLPRVLLATAALTAEGASATSSDSAAA